MRERKFRALPAWGLAVLVMAAVLLAPAAAQADPGFLLPPASAEALGRAGAVAADTDEPAAVWMNPSALAFVEGAGGSGGGAVAAGPAVAVFTG